MPKAIIPQTSKAKMGMQKSNKIFAVYAPGTKTTPRARQFANTGKFTKNATAPKINPAQDDLKQDSLDPPVLVLKEDINLRVNTKAGHYNELKKIEKTKIT